MSHSVQNDSPILEVWKYCRPWKVRHFREIATEKCFLTFTSNFSGYFEKINFTWLETLIWKRIFTWNLLQKPEGNKFQYNFIFHLTKLARNQKRIHISYHLTLELEMGSRFLEAYFRLQISYSEFSIFRIRIFVLPQTIAIFAPLVTFSVGCYNIPHSLIYLPTLWISHIKRSEFEENRMDLTLGYRKSHIQSIYPPIFYHRMGVVFTDWTNGDRLKGAQRENLLAFISWCGLISKTDADILFQVIDYTSYCSSRMHVNVG